MSRFASLTAVIAAFVLIVTITPSWGQPVCASPGCNPTVSDGHNNTAGGTGALVNVDATPAGGFDNTAFGFHALNLDNTGDGNTAIGRSALSANTTGEANTASGVQALFSNTEGDGNTATGASALFSNTTGHDNTASGVSALLTNTEGVRNTAIGGSALLLNTTGNDNTASGVEALASNTTGVENTASGGSALQLNTTGNDNTASGAGALFHNTTGNDNTATGVHALFSNTTGHDNTASGVSALLSNATGFGNIAVGTNALLLSTGNKNIAIGFNAGTDLASGHNNVYIRNAGVAAESQTMRLGDTQTRTFIAGIVTAGVSAATVQVDANGQLGIAPSSARYKQDIAPMGTSSEKVLALRPVTFAYRDDTRGVTHYGLIAEEVAAVFPELVTRTATGEVQTVKYQELIPMLLNELQRQRQDFQRELAELRALVGQRRGTEASTSATAAHAAASTR